MDRPMPPAGAVLAMQLTAHQLSQLLVTPSGRGCWEAEMLVCSWFIRNGPSWLEQFGWEASGNHSHMG